MFCIQTFIHCNYYFFFWLINWPNTCTWDTTPHLIHGPLGCFWNVLYRIMTVDYPFLPIRMKFYYYQCMYKERICAIYIALGGGQRPFTLAVFTLWWLAPQVGKPPKLCISTRGPITSVHAYRWECAQRLFLFNVCTANIYYCMLFRWLVISIVYVRAHAIVIAYWIVRSAM